MIQSYNFGHPAIILLLVLVLVWEGVWKAIALWYAGRNGHLAWFVVMCIVNTIGILDIVYIFAIGRPTLRSKQSAPPPIG